MAKPKEKKIKGNFSPKLALFFQKLQGENSSEQIEENFGFPVDYAANSFPREKLLQDGFDLFQKLRQNKNEFSQKASTDSQVLEYDFLKKEKFLNLEKGSLLRRYFPAMGIAALLFITFAFGYINLDYLLNQSSVPLTSKKIANDARVVFHVGAVYVKLGNKKLPLKLGMLLAPDSVIETGANGKCDIQIGSASLFRMDEKSEIRLAELVKNSNNKKSNTSIELYMGKLLVKPKKLQDGETFKVYTPTAVAGVRGTKFIIGTDQNNITTVSVLEGKVSLIKRIKSLENLDRKVIESSQVLRKIQENVKSDSLVLKENESIRVNPKNILELNKKVERISELIKDISQNLDSPMKGSSSRDQKLEKINSVLLAKINSKNLDKSLKDSSGKEKIQTLSIQEKSALENFSKMASLALSGNAMEQMAAFRISVQEPGDADIFLDNIHLGNGSFSGMIMPKNDYEIRIQRNGYKSLIKKISFQQGEEKFLNLTLERKENLLNRLNWRISLGERFNAVPVYGQNAAYFVSAMGNIYAVSTNGKTLWKYSLASKVQSSPIIIGKKLFISTSTGILHALDLQRGAQIWKNDIGAVIHGRPIVSGNLMLLGTVKGKLVALNFQNGQVVWTFNANSSIYSSPNIDQGVVYFGSEDNEFFAVNLSDGQKKWSFKTNQRIILSQPAIGLGMVFFGSHDRNIYALDSSTGELRWKYETFGAIMSSPKLHHGSIYIGSTDGSLYCIQALGGSLSWKIELGSRILGEMMIADNTIYIGSGKKVIAVNAKNVKKNWTYDLDGQVSMGFSTKNNLLFASSAKGTVYSFNLNLKP